VLYACALKFKSQAKLLLSTPTQINNSPPLLRPLLDYYSAPQDFVVWGFSCSCAHVSSSGG
jgi:hypothetical protein